MIRVLAPTGLEDLSSCDLNALLLIYLLPSTVGWALTRTLFIVISVVSWNKLYLTKPIIHTKY